MDSAVERAIKYIWERYSEPLTLSDIARSAILSRFHFCRIFREATGVTPGRFLSAIRIYQAKRMLVTTSVNITDISFAVGYNSLGSFTNHFTDSVGVSPGRFRRMSQNGGFEPPRQQTPSALRGTVTGTISLPPGYALARTYVGAFDTPIVQRRPLCAAVVDLDASGELSSYRLNGIPEGTWFVHAVAEADSIDPEPWTRRSLLVGTHSPVTVIPGTSTLTSMRLRPRCPADLPILLALPSLEPQPRRVATATAAAAAAVRGRTSIDVAG